MKNVAMQLMNHAAYAQALCAASFCSALNSILIIILDAGLLLGSILVLPVAPALVDNRMTARSAPICDSAYAA